MTQTTPLLELLRSDDWGHVTQGFELFRSLQPKPDLAPLLRELLPENSNIVDGDWELELYLSVWEDEVESCTFTAGEESWNGGVQHGYKTGITFEVEGDDKDAFAVITACIKADHWDSGVCDDLSWEHPDGGNPKCSDAFHFNAEGLIVEGEPTASDEDDDVEREYDEGMGSVYVAPGFIQRLGGVTATDEEGGTVDIDRENRRLFLLLLALKCGVEIDAIPSIDMEACEAELQELREECG